MFNFKKYVLFLMFGFAQIKHEYEATPVSIYVAQRGGKMNGRGKGLEATAPVPLTGQS